MKTREKILSWYVIGTGIIGLLMSVYMAGRIPQGSTVAYIYLSIVFGLSAIGIVSGINMLKRKVWAYGLALAFFALQVPHIQVGSFYYYVYVGLQLKLDMIGEMGAFGLNILALIMFIFAYRCFVSVRREVTPQ